MSSLLSILLDGITTSFINIALVTVIFFTILCYLYHITNKKRSYKRKGVYLNGIASAFPQMEYSQTQMKEMFIQNYCGGRQNLSAKDLDFIERVFDKTMIKRCCVNLPENRLYERMNRETYTTYIKHTLLMLACESAQNALKRANLLPHEVTHLVFGTMTASIRAPSLDVSIASQLQLNATVKRLNVEAMGCLTGFRLTGLCRDIASENENNVVLLVVCDIRSSLGNQLTHFSPNEPINKSNVIVSALFRDSGGAAVFSSKARSATDLCLIDHRSMLVPNSYDRVLLQEFNDGAIHLFLHKELPDTLCAHLPMFIKGLLNDYSIDITRCLFALHTGGPRIIQGVQKCLDLKAEQLFGTWYVMKNHGNLSGSSNLVVLEHILHHREATLVENMDDICMPSDFSKYLYIVGLSFGPGMGVECVLFSI